ncbi:MAG: outer membrane protein assembly factor BamB family protein, partial [Thermoguttaceae bacterium]
MPRRLHLPGPILLVCLLAGSAVSAQPGSQPAYRGKPLNYWVQQSSTAGGPENIDETVSALAEALNSTDPNVKRSAADALNLLGPKARPALPELIAQFSHEFPWVRESCQGAVAAIGKEAVPALIELMEKNPGALRVNAVFVLGAIGPDARPAVPAIERIMKTEAPVVQARMAGVLTQIDPERFPATGSVGQVRYEAGKTATKAEPAKADWPEFHGPTRDAICRETGLLQEWPEGGPDHLWTLEGLGRGYSTVSISAGRLFTMGDLSVDGTETQQVLAYDLPTRRQLWASPVGPPHADGGPRCTPTIDGDWLYALGTDGDLVCLAVDTGKERWRKNLAKDFGGKVMTTWKFSESPLVDGDRLVCTPGGPDAMMVALDKNDGSLIWKCAVPPLGEKGADGCGYASAVAAEICGTRQYVQLVGRGLIGVDARTGRFLWGYNGVANNVANIPSPIVRGDYVLATTAYNTGAVLLKISRDGEAFKADEVYFTSPKDFQNHHGGVVVVGDYIYGGHGPNRGDPRCLEFGTGKIVWQERAAGRGSASVLYADGRLIFRYDRGSVYLLAATPEGYQFKGHLEPPIGEGPAWAHPVIHGGRLYLRHANLLACYDLRAPEPTAWFHEAGGGGMTHYLGAPPSSSGGAELTAEMWNQQVDAFDARGLADQLASAGAKYLLFTIGQNSGHYCAPNATYDRLVGISPSKCSRRDLVADLAKELKPRG